MRYVPSVRFAGQWFAAENGLHQNWMRDYDATLGRYIQADPLGLVDGASVYGYALGNLARWSDPRGEEAVGVIGGVVGSGIAAGGAVVGGGIATVIGILLIPSTMGDGTLLPEQMAAQQEGAQQCSPSQTNPWCFDDWEDEQAQCGARYGICKQIAGTNRYLLKQCARELGACLETAKENFLKCVGR